MEHYQNFGEESLSQEISLTAIGDGGCVDTQSVEIDVFPEFIVENPVSPEIDIMVILSVSVGAY